MLRANEFRAWVCLIMAAIYVQTGSSVADIVCAVLWVAMSFHHGWLMHKEEQADRG